MKNTNERKSIIRGIIANPATKSFEEFEVETAYTRSEIKACELAREALNLENRAIMVSVTEIINEAVKPIVYDAQSLIDFADAVYDYERVFLLTCGQPCSTGKGVAADTGDGCRNRDFRKIFAVVECIIFDAGDIVRDTDRCQAGAALEYAGFECADARRNTDRSDAGTGKRIHLHFSDAGGERNGFQAARPVPDRR